MNRTPIDWVLNPDGTPGYTWNPITGCLNGCEYCYARKLANGRLKQRYLANKNIAPFNFSSYESLCVLDKANKANPFYPRFWEDRLEEPLVKAVIRGRTTVINVGKQKGIFTCDMSDLFGIGIPEEWTRKVMQTIEDSPHRFYLLTKQPQNLIKFSPFPDNCWVGVTATDYTYTQTAVNCLNLIEAKVKYISFEPLLFWGLTTGQADDWISSVDWVIIGAQTSPKKLPKWDWVREIIEACDKVNIPVFLKDNLGLPRLSCEGATPFYKRHPSGTMELRQEIPVCQKPQ